MNKSISKEYWYVIIAGLMSGLVVFSGQVMKNFGLSLFELSTIPFFFAIITLGLMSWRNGEISMNKKLFLIFLLYGLVTAATTICQYAGVFFGLPVAIVVLLLYTQPFWTAIFSVTFMKEKISKTEVFSCILVLVGVYALINPSSFDAAGKGLALTFSIIGGVMLSGWISVGSWLSKKGNHPINSLFWQKIIAIIILFLVFPIAAPFISDKSVTGFTLHQSAPVWLFVLLYGVVILVANHLFYLNGVKKVRTIDAGIIMLLEPVVGTLLAYLFFKQSITISTLVGGLLILFANYLVITKKETNG